MPLHVVKKKVRQRDGSYAESRNWYLRGTVGGEAVDESTGTDLRAIAEEIRVKRESEIHRRRLYGAEVTMSFAEAVNRYLDGGGSERFLNPLIRHFGVTLVSRIDLDAINEAARKLYPGCAPATINRQVFTPMVAVLRSAGVVLLIKRPEQKKPSMVRPNRDYATPEHYQKLLNAIEDMPHLYRLVLFMTYTGRRIGECVRLDWERDIDLQNRIAYMGVTKNGDDIAVHIPSPIFEEMANVTDKTGPVFLYTDSKAPNRALKRRCKKAGIPYLSCHRIGRHTFATWMRRYGKLDRKALKEAGGWKSDAAVEVYMHVTPDELPEARSRLPRFGKNMGSADIGTGNDLKKKGNSGAA